MTDDQRHVLCPVDFSDFSRRALDHAIAMAAWYEARLTVLYVHPAAMPVAVSFGRLTESSVEPSALAPADREHLQRQLQAFIPAHAARNVPVECAIAEGDVVQEILAQAASADLLVMGTHGRSGVEHLLLGSVAEEVLRRAPCSVLTIPRATPDATQAVPVLFHQILAAIDFSELSMQAVAFAISLAEETDAHLTVLHVIDLPPRPALWIDGAGGASHVSAMTDAATRRMRSAIPDAVRVYCHIEERVETGVPYREILRVAGERGAGLVVVGAQGHGMVERMLVGSTAEQVVRHAACPVLAVRKGLGT